MLKLYMILQLGLSLALCLNSTANSVGKITKGSVISITIKGVPTDEQSQVNGDYHVGSSGKIKLPLTGTLLTVHGITNDQLERKIEAVYKQQKIYKEPVIEVFVRGKDDPEKRTLSVGGHVKRAGRIQWSKGMTVLQAIQAAGDKSQFGSKHIFLHRGQKKYSLNTKLLNHQNTLVLPNDTIQVLQKGPFGDL